LRQYLASLALILTFSQEIPVVHAVSIPEPSGPYHVGVTKHTIEHYNDQDPLAPNNVSTAFLATIFYPTEQTPQSPPKPYLDPEIAATYESAYNYTPGVLASLTSTLQEDAPFLTLNDSESGASLPTILFGPGGVGPPTECNTIILAELASYGYTVVGLDHPFEQPFLRFPNGTGVVGVDVNLTDFDLIEAIYRTRLIDNAVFLRYFPTLVRELNAPFNVDRYGLLGRSLGGAAALGTILDEQNEFNLIAGLNLDGSLWGQLAGNSSAVDLHKPVLLLGELLNNTPTWRTFPPWQTGYYYRKILINGTLHHDFSDDTFWKTVEPGVDHTVGPIDGLRQTEIMNTFVGAFFDYTLLGMEEGILHRPSALWPELTYFYNNGSIVP
jgi:hypothetical protein